MIQQRVAVQLHTAITELDAVKEKLHEVNTIATGENVHDVIETVQVKRNNKFFNEISLF